jgi:hypothetical protein
MSRLTLSREVVAEICKGCGAEDPLGYVPALAKEYFRPAGRVAESSLREGSRKQN